MTNSHSTRGPVMFLRPLALNENLFLEIALSFFFFLMLDYGNTGKESD